MATPLDALNRLLAPLRTRVANLVARAVVQLVSDAGKLQSVQLGVLEGETREGCERFQEYGFTSVPFAGAEAVVLFVGGRRDHGLVVAVDDRRYRLKGLKEGEVALYHKDGARVLLKADGSIEVDAKPGANIVLNGGTKAVARVDDEVSVGYLAGTTAQGPVTFTLTSTPPPTGPSVRLVGAVKTGAGTVKA